jgi:hypothetical protein
LPFFSETTLYPSFTFFIIRYPPAPIFHYHIVESILRML